MDITQAKHDLREATKAAIGKASLDDRAEWDSRIIQHLRDIITQLDDEPLTAMVYMPLPDEVDISALVSELIGQAVRVVLPRMGEQDSLTLHHIQNLTDQVSRKGRYAVVEPNADRPLVAPESVDVMIVPGRAFSRDGFRLGRGRGCYDRLLKKANVLCVGAAYSAQVHDDIPHTEHDQPVHFIVTPEEIIETDIPR